MLTILCVDSNQQQLTNIQQDLLSSRLVLHLLSAKTQSEALQKIEQEKHTISIIICAQLLSDGSANNLFKLMKNTLTRKIIYAHKPCCSDLISLLNENKIDHFILLPYQRDALKTLITAQFHQYKNNIEHALRTKNMPLTAIQENLFNIRKGSLTNISTFQDRFLDYSIYSDKELSLLVIQSLYKILEDNDEHQVIRTYRSGHLLTREGETNCFLWFISKGKVLLRKRNDRGKVQDIINMHEGSMVGGMSFITGEKSFSTGITLVETEVLKVSHSVFSKILQSNVALLAPFTNLLLRNFNRRLQHSITTELALQESLKSLDAAHEQLVSSEKMAVLGQLVAGVAHELNNPISAILRGSDNLTSLISALFSTQKNNKFSELAFSTLLQGLTLIPLSTSEIRRRSKKLMQTMENTKLAKMLVSMHLDETSIPLEYGRDIEESIILLDKFYQAGCILRNNKVCAARIADLVKSLKHYAGQDNPSSKATNIHDGIEETLIIFENKLKHYEVIKEYQILPNIECYPIELEQVWTNIISNAIDATEGAGKLTIMTKYYAHEAEPCIQVIIEDDGPGINAEQIDKIFELNYTTKRKGNFGLGIGLTICSQIVTSHNGHIEVQSELGEFTRFIITLPIASTNIKSARCTFLSTEN
ncbi:sensor histidine kinase [Psychromonas sp. CNPT3]|uniref:ATP-binding protein n=1 Tax=Psychromonas sp. CNPT3 TaxID=314282 RepID=UPI00006E956E|nr:ATP-binding protein [Psychromonas sp. CNPT3]AGH80240.1 sensor histidine kinase [Psychromonas sp. CNPT3]